MPPNRGRRRRVRGRRGAGGRARRLPRRRLRSARWLAAAASARRSCEPTFALSLEPTIVSGRAERIARAVANLIDNARKWNPPHGTVEIRLAAGVLSVRDHGPGFDAQDLPHVFDRFYRANDARGMPGSGLGLAIVRQAALACRGDARAANADGGGALLVVSFGPPEVPSQDCREGHAGRSPRAPLMRT